MLALLLVGDGQRELWICGRHGWNSLSAFFEISQDIRYSHSGEFEL
jgi:hypothetical protein